MKHYNIRVQGKVQGVFFRASTRATAQTLGLNGFVKNESDGSVYIEVEGDDRVIMQLITWCHQGPARCRVDRVIAEEGAMKYFTSFEIRR